MFRQKIYAKVIIIIALIFIISSAFAQPERQKARQIKINDELYYNIIADDVYMITHYFPNYGSNSLFVF